VGGRGARTWRGGRGRKGNDRVVVVRVKRVREVRWAGQEREVDEHADRTHRDMTINLAQPPISFSPIATTLLSAAFHQPFSSFFGARNPALSFVNDLPPVCNRSVLLPGLRAPATTAHPTHTYRPLSEPKDCNTRETGTHTRYSAHHMHTVAANRPIRKTPRMTQRRGLGVDESSSHLQVFDCIQTHGADL